LEDSRVCARWSALARVPPSRVSIRPRPDPLHSIPPGDQHPAVQKADTELKEAKAKLTVRESMRKHARRSTFARTSRVHSAHAGLVRIASRLYCLSHSAPPRALMSRTLKTKDKNTWTSTRGKRRLECVMCSPPPPIRTLHTPVDAVCPSCVCTVAQGCTGRAPSRDSSRAPWPPALRGEPPVVASRHADRR